MTGGGRPDPQRRLADGAAGRPHRDNDDEAKVCDSGAGIGLGRKGCPSRRVKGSGLRAGRGRAGRGPGRHVGGGGGDLSLPMMASMVKAGRVVGRVSGGEGGDPIRGLTGVGVKTAAEGGAGPPPARDVGGRTPRKLLKNSA